VGIVWSYVADNKGVKDNDVQRRLAMFVQIIQGRVSDPDRLHAATDRWIQELSPTATGWLGTTGGVTEDGRSIAMVRFASEAAAKRNSERPEQDLWWAETSKLFDGEPTFHNSSDITVDVNGDPDRAGFVQVIQGRGSDPDRARELMAQDSDKWAALRPDVIGSVAVEHEAGAYTMVMYFTSEADARDGERKELPVEMQAQMDEMAKLNLEEPEFFDLKDPWIRSAK
jgi:hypothetical protein